MTRPVKPSSRTATRDSSHVSVSGCQRALADLIARRKKCSLRKIRTDCSSEAPWFRAFAVHCRRSTINSTVFQLTASAS
jgi:hypothetical protein